MFFVLALGGERSQAAEARTYFADMGLGTGLAPDIGVIVSSVVLAGVCEELLYRGTVLRPIHDALARRGRPTAGAIAGIAVSTVAFAMPHLGSLTPGRMVAYLVTGVALGLVHVATGSMTAEMVSHSLQSLVAFGQIIVLGHGATHVSPLVYVVLFGCRLWVYLCARGVRGVLPSGTPRAA